MVVMRSDWSPEASHLTFDCGNAGMGYSDDGKYTTHGHDDLLSITLSAGGRQLLVDRGSGSYTGDRAIHDSLRTSMAHNTVSLSAPIRERSRLLSAAVQSHSVTGSTWELERRARPFGRGFIASESVDLAWASHDGYRRYPNQPLHQRIVLFFKPGLFVVIDRITPLKASQHKFLYPLHFAPGTRLVDLDTGVIARTDGVELLCKRASPVPMLERNVYEGKKNPVLGWFAEDYGVLVPSPTVEYVGVVELPATMAAMFQVGKDVDPSAYDIRLIAADQCPEEIAVQAATDSYRIAFAGPDDRTLPNGETSASDAWLTIRKLERETHKETTWTVGQDVMEERAGDTVRHLRPITLMLGRCSRDGTDTLSAPPPSTIYIVINNKCNLRCKMCDAGQQNHQSQFYRLMRPKGRLLDLPTLKGLADHVAPFKPHIAIVGSEPLLFRDLFTFVEHVKSLGMEVQVTTNGLLLPAMAEKVVDSGVDYLWVSIDGPREVHNEIRGHKRSFQYAVNGIQLVHAFARQKERNLSIYVHCALSNHNYRHLVDFVEAIRTLPLESIQISHMNYVTLEMAQRHNRIHGHFCRATASSVSAADPRQVDADLLWDQMNVVKYYQYPFPVRFDPDLDRDGVRDFYHHPEKVLWTETCDIAWKAAHVAPNGDCIIATRCFEKSMGNIFEHDLLEIWNGQRYRDFRGWIRDVRLAPACTRCCSVL
jgi:MoaA/NifB/PqqE/SkfB family radical SAM enzyme